MKLTKRYSSGLTYLIGYTWSKTMDTGSAIRTHDGDTLFPQNSGCRACEYGLSSFNTAHRLVTSALYDIPFGKGRTHSIENPILNGIAGGWQVGGIADLADRIPDHDGVRAGPVEHRRRIRSAERHRDQSERHRQSNDGTVFQHAGVRYCSRSERMVTSAATR